MPSLTIPNTFLPNTTIYSTDVNANFQAVQTLLNTTGLDSSNIASGGIATANLADSLITAAKIAAGAVTPVKMTTATVTKTATYTATTSDFLILCDTTSGGITINLPAVASYSGPGFIIKKISNDSNTVVVDGNSAETIDGNATVTIKTRYDYLYIICNGSAWYIVCMGSAIVTPSVVELQDGNGHGSTNTKIRRYTTTVTNQGTAITYADSATAGMSLTINEDGIYGISMSDIRSGGAEDLGATLNSTEVTTSINSLSTPSKILCIQRQSAAAINVSASAIFKASVGDVVRVHTDGQFDSTNGFSKCKIYKIA